MPRYGGAFLPDKLRGLAKFGFSSPSVLAIDPERLRQLLQHDKGHEAHFSEPDNAEIKRRWEYKGRL
jgi:hypothetical protein